MRARDAREKKFSKPLDKPLEKCYNKDNPRGTGGVPADSDRAAKKLLESPKKHLTKRTPCAIINTESEVREWLVSLAAGLQRRNCGTYC